MTRTCTYHEEMVTNLGSCSPSDIVGEEVGHNSNDEMNAETAKEEETMAIESVSNPGTTAKNVQEWHPFHVFYEG